MVDMARLGRCYELAGREVMENGGVLVHAIVHTSRRPDGFGHAWVEKGTEAWEPITEVTMSVETLRRLYSPSYEVKYDQEQVCIQSLRTGKWGPWDPTIEGSAHKENKR